MLAFFKLSFFILVVAATAATTRNKRSGSESDVARLEPNVGTSEAVPSLTWLDFNTQNADNP